MAQTIYRTVRDVDTAQAQIIPPAVIGDSIDLMTNNAAPFTNFMRAAKKLDPIGDNTYFVFDTLLLKYKTKLTAAVAVAGTTWNVTAGTGAYIQGWDLLWNRDKDVLVHAKSRSTDAITVLANADSGTDTAGEIGDEIIIMGSACQEGNGVGQSLSVQETKRTNYVVDHLTVWGFTDMGLNSDSYFKRKDPAQQKLERMIVHQRGLEAQAKLAGQAALITVAATYEYPTVLSTFKTGFTESLRAFMRDGCDSDHWHTETDLTEDEFLDILPNAFYAEDEGQNKKKIVCLTAREFLTAATKWNIGRGRFTEKTSKKEATLGMNFTEWDSPHGLIKLKADEMLRHSDGGFHFMMFIDLSRIGWVPYRNLDTHVVKDCDKSGSMIRQQINYVRTVGGTNFTQPNAHMFLKFKTSS